MTSTIEPYRFGLLATASEIRHGITQREGPGLAGNMSFSRGPDRESVLAARARWCQRLGIELTSLVLNRQVHGTEVNCVTAVDRGRGAFGTIDHPEADVLATDTPGVSLMAVFADCVPILLADPARGVIAVAHAGWRGTIAGIARRAVGALQQHYGSEPGDLIAGIGPSIGPCCYEVGPEVARAGSARCGAAILRPAANSSRSYLNLWSANQAMLIAAGVQAERVEVAGVCTRCHVDRYFSHRAEGPQRGLFAAIIALA